MEEGRALRTQQAMLHRLLALILALAHALGLDLDLVRGLRMRLVPAPCLRVQGLLVVLALFPYPQVLVCHSVRFPGGLIPCQRASILGTA